MLKPILLANAASCLGFGAIFAAMPAATAEFLGDPPVWLISVIGVGLILNGLNLLWVARKSRPGRFEILQFVIGDAVWVVATLVLVGLGLWVTTPAGIAAALAVALWVEACGFGQFVYRPATGAA